MSDNDKCFPDSVQNPYRGAAPPEAYTVIGTAKPHFIEIPFTDEFLDSDVPESLYEGGRTLEEVVAELEGNES